MTTKMNGSAKADNNPPPFGENIPRRQCIPILYTRGTHYDVGFDMVRNGNFFYQPQMLIYHNNREYLKTADNTHNGVDKYYQYHLKFGLSTRGNN